MPSDSDGESATVAENVTKCKICNCAVNRGGVKCFNVNCQSSLHKKCFDLVLKTFSVDKQNWRCKYCTVSDSNNAAGCSTHANPLPEVIVLQKEVDCLKREKSLLEKLLDEISYTSEILKTRLQEFENDKNAGISQFLAAANKTQVSSYSEVVKTHVNKASDVLLVKTLEQGVSNKSIESTIKSRINPGSLNANVMNTKLIKDGVLIRCSDKESVNILKTTISQELGPMFNVCEPKKFNPRIIVFGVENVTASQPASTIVESFAADNHLNIDDGDISLVTKIKNHELYNLVFEVTPVLYKDIILRKKLLLGWKSCHFKENFYIRRCFKCCKYGHTKDSCKSNYTVCPKCSKNHDKVDCNLLETDPLCCVNCTELNVKHKLGIPVDHAVTSPNCHCYVNLLNSFKQKINYNV